MEAERFVRPLGAIERMRLWYPNISVVMAARVDGPLAEKDVVAALATAAIKHPLLHARVSIDSSGSAAFTTEGAPPPAVEVLHQAHVWEDVVAAELKRPWDVENGPLTRVVLLPAEDHTVLVFSLHHSICDGRSLARLIRDVTTFARAPRTRNREGRVTPVAVDSVIDAGPRGLSKLVFRLVNKRWLRKNIRFGQADYEALHSRYWETHEKSLVHWALDEDETARIVAASKSHRVSVNSGIYVAFLQAVEAHADHLPSAPDRVLVPVDFRRFVGHQIDEALGLYSSAVAVEGASAFRGDFRRAVASFDAVVKRKVTEEAVFASQRLGGLHPSLLDGICHALFGDFDDPLAVRLAEKVVARTRSHVLVSNLGRIADAESPGLARLYPPAVAAGTADFAVEVLTFRGRLHFTMTHDSTIDALAARVRDDAMAALTTG